jgi:hypothetical protein
VKKSLTAATTSSKIPPGQIKRPSVLQKPPEATL